MLLVPMCLAGLIFGPIPGASALAPNAPTLTAAGHRSATDIKVVWIDASTNELAFGVQYRTYHGPWKAAKSVASTSKATTGTRYSVRHSPVKAETVYCYRVGAGNLDGTKNSAEKCAAGGAPSAPRKFRVRGNSLNTLALGFVPTATWEYRYRIEYRLQSSTRWLRARDYVPTAPPKGLVWQYIGNLKTGSTYCARVTAYNAAGSTPSAQGTRCAQIEPIIE